eukprot:13913567-Ditylum_brightwellii.AAC.1
MKRKLTKNGTGNMVQEAEMVSDREETDPTSTTNSGSMTMSCPRWDPILIHTLQPKPRSTIKTMKGSRGLKMILSITLF